MILERGAVSFDRGIPVPASIYKLGGDLRFVISFFWFAVPGWVRGLGFRLQGLGFRVTV